MIVHKYRIELEDEQVITMPEDAEMLSVQIQYGEPHIWMLVPHKPSKLVDRRFRLFGTGQLIPGEFKKDDNLHYLDTFQIMGGNIVLHLFEETDDQNSNR